MLYDLDNAANLKKITDAAKYGRLMKIGDKHEFKNIKDAYLEAKDILMIESSIKL
jgi:glycine betaine/choline ABC-type transport system substrate-binding protein